MYDIIGDVHGKLDKLLKLLNKMGYVEQNGSFSHPKRKVIFVGDLVDRGDKIREVVELAYKMVNQGVAQLVLGNHEFNLLMYLTPHPLKAGEFLQAHTEERNLKHKETIEQFSGYKKELDLYLEWFHYSPLWLELDDLRIVHASWDFNAIEYLNQRLSGRQHINFDLDFLLEYLDVGSATQKALQILLRGKELPLPNDGFYVQPNGKKQNNVRIDWWKNLKGMSYKEVSLKHPHLIPDIKIPNKLIQFHFPYPINQKPVFFGHYGLRPLRHEFAPLAKNVACVDYNSISDTQGSLAAYRWDGEQKLLKNKFVFV